MFYQTSMGVHPMCSGRHSHSVLLQEYHIYRDGDILGKFEASWSMLNVFVLSSESGISCKLSNCAFGKWMVRGGTMQEIVLFFSFYWCHTFSLCDLHFCYCHF